MVSIRFPHGLGDAANFAHQIPLYLRRGHEIHVETFPDRAPLFEAAGAETAGNGEHVHVWDHAPCPQVAELHDHWSGNKSAFNISRWPMPDIGGYWELWDEYCAVRLSLDKFVTPEIRQAIDRFIAQLPRPLVLLHTKGNTCTECQDLADGETLDLYRGLLDETDAGIILLDWDDRVARLNNGRVRHLTDDWRTLGTIELYYLLQRADLLIGVDSGPLHFVRFTDCPAIGLWTGHFPSSYILPRTNTLNIYPASAEHSGLIRYRRLPYNVVDCPGDRVCGEFVAEQAARMLAAPRYLRQRAQDVLLQSLVGQCRQFGSPMTSFMDRHRSFDKALLFLQSTEKPVMAETGCVRAEEDFSAGFSTYLFGFFLANHGGVLHSVDLNADSVAFARAWTTPYGDAVKVHRSHSHEWLRAYGGAPIDLIYLDSADFGTEGCEECCLEEARLALPRLAERAAVLIDDTCWGQGQFHGKGVLAVPWLLDRGFRIHYAGYQVLLVRGNV